MDQTAFTLGTDYYNPAYMKIQNILQRYSYQKLVIYRLSLFLIGAILGCSNDGHRPFRYSDEFYNSKGGFDYKRLPLIKPYEVISTGNSLLTWGYNLRNKSAYPFSQTPAQGLAITKDFILLKYTGKYGFDNNPKTELYTLIDRKNGQEYVLESSQELQTKLDSLSMKSKLKFDSLDSLFEQYMVTNKLPWLDDSGMAK